MSFPEVLPYVHPKNLPKNCSCPSWYAKVSLNSLQIILVQYFMGYLSKMTCIIKNYPFRPKKSISLGTFDILTKPQKNTQQLHLLSLLKIWCQVGNKGGFPFNCQYILLFLTFLVCTLCRGSRKKNRVFWDSFDKHLNSKATLLRSSHL